MQNTKNMIIWVLVVVVFVGVLVFITNKKGNEGINMQNTQEIKGVKITVLKEGTGAVAADGDTVSMNYTGKFENGTAFDSNVDPKFQHVQPFVFTIGAGQVIKGWDSGIAGMKVGEKRNLTIQPDYAYGERGQGSIPPNTTLTFDVELLGIKK
jgi:FKBP-type peptidyl-prolyl cis-trans isomerase